MKQIHGTVATSESSHSTTKWLQEWIDQVVELLQEEWKSYCPQQADKSTAQSNDKVRDYN